MKVIAVEDKATDSWDLSWTPIGSKEWAQAKGLVAIIKATIPASDRTYDAVTKHWSILSKYYPALKSAGFSMLLNWIEEKPYEQEKFFYEETLNAPTVVTKELIAAQLCLLLEVPSETLEDSVMAKKAYRSAALKYHPDRNNGDGSRMSELNSLWSSYNQC